MSYDASFISFEKIDEITDMPENAKNIDFYWVEGGLRVEWETPDE